MKNKIENLNLDEDNGNKEKQGRPPVVVVLGHVDHGKSSILEAIKDLKITAKESGGITQHIGAYEVEHQGKKITFIDTPGHEAFSAMRSRGAKIADVAVLVVAGDEGVKPQTKEAISHIREASIPMVVAINKIDKPEADPERAKRELAKESVLVESIGGDIPSVNVSARTKEGLSDLLEVILLLAEMEGLAGDVLRPAKGVVVESHLDSNRGPTATVILKEGKLKEGDILATASAFGRVKAIEDFQGKPVSGALPSMPVIVIGFEDIPNVGEEFSVFNSIEEAKKSVKEKKQGFFENLELAPEAKNNLNLILRVDVIGSLEAIQGILRKVNKEFLEEHKENLGEETVGLKIIRGGVGEIGEADVRLAMATGAKIIGFRVKTNQIAKNLIQREKITVINFETIYDLAKAVRNLLEKQVRPRDVKVYLGKIRVLAVFLTDKDRQIIGGRVVDGEVKQSSFLEIYRDEEKVGEGKIIELQKNKKKVGQVEKGSECGILYKGEVKIEKGDILQSYVKERS